MQDLAGMMCNSCEQGEMTACDARVVCDYCGLSRERFVPPIPCDHDWKVWPETDGQEQRCMVCNAYRKTPKEIELVARNSKKPEKRFAAGARNEAKIICLFCVANNYDQPQNNLVAFWIDKPSIEAVASALGYAFPASDDATTLAVVKLWGGETVTLPNGDDVRLQEVIDGEIL